MLENLKGAPRALTGHGRIQLTTAGGTCLVVDRVMPNRTFRLGDVMATTGGGAPQAIELAKGPITVAGRSFLDTTTSSVGLDERVFLALSVGTTAADARIIQNQVQPLRTAGTLTGVKRTVELPSVAVVVPAGQSLFLTVSPVSDMFVAHGSRTPGVLTLADVRVRVPVVKVG